MLDHMRTRERKQNRLGDRTDTRTWVSSFHPLHQYHLGTGDAAGGWQTQPRPLELTV